MSRPAISVIMASYNGAGLIAETIESVLRQTCRDFELIVADDCSTDDTVGVLRRFADPRIRLLRTPHNMGPVGARNLACAEARGEFFAALDQDDLCHPERFARQRAHLAANPRTVAVGTATARLTGKRLRPDPVAAGITPGLMRWMLHTTNPLVWSSMMIRGSAARVLVPFSRDEYRFAEDYDLYHRLAVLGDVTRLDATLTTYRNHESGASQRHRARMHASASAVLARIYNPWFGDRAGSLAGLMVRHLAGRDPVSGPEELHLVSQALGSVHEVFLAAYAPGPETRVLIAQDLSQRWWQIARAGLRAGHLRPREISRQRPPFASPQGLAPADQLSSATLGLWRAGAANVARVEPLRNAGPATNA